MNFLWLLIHMGNSVCQMGPTCAACLFASSQLLLSSCSLLPACLPATSLTLNSEDGVAPGALCSLSQLATLQELRLGDVDGNNPEDIATVCDMVTRLTSLHMVRSELAKGAPHRFSVWSKQEQGTHTV